jgi:hypothetical protein
LVAIFDIAAPATRFRSANRARATFSGLEDGWYRSTQGSPAGIAGEPWAGEFNAFGVNKTRRIVALTMRRMRLPFIIEVLIN